MLNNELYFCNIHHLKIYFPDTEPTFIETNTDKHPPSSWSLCACRWKKHCSQCCDETEWLLWAFQLFPENQNEKNRIISIHL